MYKDREIFPNAPLEFVAGEVKFPFAPQLSKDDRYERIGEALKPSLPLTEREDRPRGVSITPGGVTPVEAHVVWRYLNRKRTASVTLSPTNLTVETTDYAEYAEFRELLRLALSALADLDAVVGIERVGLRYIDEIRLLNEVSGPTGWSGYINEAFLAPLSVVEGFDPVVVEGALRLDRGPGRSLVMRYGALDGLGVVGDGPLRRRTHPSPGPFFMLDLDSYWNGNDLEVPEFVPEAVLELFDTLHDPVGELFQRLITEKYKNEVARRERA